MRLVIQRAKRASVTIDGKMKSEINLGILALVGIEDRDVQEDIEWMTNKIINLRIFDDEDGVMNKSIKEVDGDILIVSQFTLHASTKKGNRPSYIKASKPNFAVPMYEQFCQKVEAALGKKIGTGEFGANMQVELVNDGPVTIIIDSQNRE